MEEAREGSAGMIRVLMADDHQVVRRGLRKIMDDEADMDLCGEAENAEELLCRIREEDWDVLILDIGLPDRSGLEVLEEIREMRPELHVLVLSMHTETQYAKQALAKGASGYVTKDGAAEEVVQAVREVMRGERYVSPRLAMELRQETEW